MSKVAINGHMTSIGKLRAKVEELEVVPSRPGGRRPKGQVPGRGGGRFTRGKVKAPGRRHPAPVSVGAFTP